VRGLVRSLLGSGTAAADTPVDAAPHVSVRDAFRRFWPDTRGLRGWMVLGLALVALASASSGADIWLFKILIDDVLVPRDFRVFPLLAVGYVGITLGGGLVSFANQYIAAWTGETFIYRLRNRVFAHIHTLSVSFFDRSRLGDVLSRLGSDVGSIENLVLSGLVQVFSAVVELVLYTALLCYLNWPLALLSFTVVPLFGIASRVFSRRIRRTSREARRRSGALAAVAEESLGNAIFIQAYGRRDRELARFAEQGEAGMRASLAAARVGGLFGPLVDLLQVAGVLLIMGVGVRQLLAGQITLGGLLVFLVYLSQLYGPVSGLTQLSTTLYTASAAAERIVEVLDRRPLVQPPAEPRALTRVTGEVRLDAVSFTYPDTTGDVLREVSCRLAPGTVTALVGASGAGKTTVTKLLLRLYDPTVGSITLDDRDLRELDPDRLREQIAVVLQETLLLDDTIAENILAGRSGASEDEMVEAARAADAHEFITAFPEGYRTRVGQRGRLLSGGQRQRIAIARAMIRDAPILVLDEPTTSIDATTTDRILQPLRRLMAGRTTLLISHDLRTVTEADQILYLESGHVTATGTHTELLAASPGYARLYHLHHPARTRPVA
jgi:ATP-binding cassette, subfamily B, bacterial